MRKRFIIVMAVIGLLASCSHPAGHSEKPDTLLNTAIIFDNTNGICTVSVYNDYRRQEEDKIAEIHAGNSSEEIAWTPGDSVTFYFSYSVKLKGINGFSLNYIPEIGKDQKAVRIDSGIKTIISIPKLDETVSPDTLLSDKSYLLIQNNSSYSFQLHRGTSILSPDNISTSLVNSGERAQYTINPGTASPYQLLIGADYKTFSGSIISFEAGCVYSFIFDGNITLISEVEIKLDNVASSSPNGLTPPAPNAPIVKTGDGLLTLTWTAVQGAENYEVYLSNTQQPPSSPIKTVAGTTTVLSSLTNRTTYYIWIKAVNSSGSGDFSPFSRGIPWPINQVPAVPGTPKIIPGINQLTVNWDECGGAVSYEVYKNTSTERPSEPEIVTDKTDVVIRNLENNVIYYVWVRSVNSTGKSDYSPLEAGTPKVPTTAPTSPARPILTVGSRELIVSWQSVELAASYEVWFGTSNNSAQAQKYGGDIDGSVTRTVITGLVNETTYYVWIKAKNMIGTSGFSYSASTKPSAFAVLPETPILPTVTPGSRTLNISWLKIEGALSYEIWAGVTDNSANAQKYGVDVSSTAVTLTGFINDTKYYLWIKAKNNIGVSGFSPSASGTPSAFAATPPTPQSAPTVIDGSGQLTISWQTVEGAITYEVWVGTANNSSTATKRGDDVSGLSSVITGLSNGTTYYVWIKAKNTVGTSNFSPATSGIPSAFLGIPQAPSVPSISIDNRQITVTWAAVEGATAYEVWMGTTNNSASATKNGVDITTSLSATISSLTNGTTYYFWIKAKNSYGTSGFSVVASGKPIANATTPTLSSSNEQLSVTWTAITGAEQYEVFFGTGINPPETASQTITGTSTTISGLVNGTTYNVWIRGKNTTGTGTMSNAASAKPVGIMGTVTIVSGNSQITVSWSSVAGADQYEVYRNTTNSIPASPSQTVSTTTSKISNLTNGTTYYIWVKPKNANGTGNASSVQNGKPLGTPGTPSLTPGLNQLQVTWTAVAGADEYEVYYGLGTPTTLYVTTTSTTATISGLTNGTTYYVRLRAKNTNGISDYGPNGSEKTLGRSPGLYRGDVKIGTQNLTASLSYISSYAVTGDDYYIALGTNESVSPKTLSYSGKNVKITLLGSDSERTLTLNSNGSMFTINSGVTLSLDENITLVGLSSNNAALVNISGGNLVMSNGAMISGNTNTSSSSNGGGGVQVYSGTFTMNGGTINGNTTSSSGGGGVKVSSNGIFIMNGGKITQNEDKSGYGGGGVIVFGGTFTMNGGTVSGNTAARFGGGVHVYSSGNFTMYGGIISGNTAKESGGGVDSSNYSFKKFPFNGIQNCGFIYGSEAVGIDSDGLPLKNTSSNNRGHSVYGSNQYRNTTVGETDQIDTTTGKGLSANGNPPFGQ